MTLFRKTSAVIAEKIAGVDREVRVARAALGRHALQSTINDTPEADADQAELYRLAQRRAVLVEALAEAEAQEAASDAQKARRQAEAQARGLDQHLASYRKASVGVAEAVAALTKHYKDGRAALLRVAGAVGDHFQYPGLSVAALQQEVHAELYRVSAEPTPIGDRSELVPVPPGLMTGANRIPPMVREVERLTKDWAGRYRRELGLAPDAPPRTGDSRAAEKPDAAAPGTHQDTRADVEVHMDTPAGEGPRSAVPDAPVTVDMSNYTPSFSEEVLPLQSYTPPPDLPPAAAAVVAEALAPPAPRRSRFGLSRAQARGEE